MIRKLSCDQYLPLFHYSRKYINYLHFCENSSFSGIDSEFITLRYTSVSSMWFLLQLFLWFWWFFDWFAFRIERFLFNVGTLSLFYRNVRFVLRENRVNKSATAIYFIMNFLVKFSSKRGKWAFWVIPWNFNKMFKVIRLEFLCAVGTSKFLCTLYIYGLKTFGIVFVLFSTPATWLLQMNKNKITKICCKAKQATCSSGDPWPVFGYFG